MERGTGINVMALMRAVLNENGHDWKECEAVVAKVSAQIEGAAWLETDTGRTFDLGFVPTAKGGSHPNDLG